MASIPQTALQAFAFLATVGAAIAAYAAGEARSAAGIEQAPLLAHFAEDIQALNPVGQAPRADVKTCKGTVASVSYQVSASPAQIRALHAAAMRKYGAPMAATVTISHGAVPPLVYRTGDVSLTIETAGETLITHHRREGACGLRAS
jgi:hypothetical protein